MLSLSDSWLKLRFPMRIDSSLLSRHVSIASERDAKNFWFANFGGGVLIHWILRRVIGWECRLQGQSVVYIQVFMFQVNPTFHREVHQSDKLQNHPHWNHYSSLCELYSSQVDGVCHLSLTMFLTNRSSGWMACFHGQLKSFLFIHFFFFRA